MRLPPAPAPAPAPLAEDVTEGVETAESEGSAVWSGLCGLLISPDGQLTAPARAWAAPAPRSEARASRGGRRCAPCGARPEGCEEPASAVGPLPGRAAGGAAGLGGAGGGARSPQRAAGTRTRGGLPGRGASRSPSPPPPQK